MKKRNIVLCMMMVLVMMVCSACASSNVDVQVREDGSVAVNTTTLLKKTETDLVLATLESQMEQSYGADAAQQYLAQINGELTKNDLVTEDGVEYYCIKEGKECANEKEVQTYLKENAGFANVSVDKEHFYGAIVQEKTSEDINEEQMNQMLDSTLAGGSLTKDDLTTMVNNTKATITISFPQAVTYSNGTYEQGSNQVTWNFSSDDAKNLGEIYVIYAETTAESTIEADKTAPSVTGIKNKGIYKNKAIKVTDNKAGVAGILLDGSVIENGDKIASVTSEGKHTLMVYDFSMNKKTISFTYDKTKPVVKGVANGKSYKKSATIKFSDKYGVKSAKLNGKTIKSGKKVTKKGSYTLKVTDKAGNVRTVKFKIKK